MRPIYVVGCGVVLAAAAIAWFWPGDRAAMPTEESADEAMQLIAEPTKKPKAKSVEKVRNEARPKRLRAKSPKSKSAKSGRRRLTAEERAARAALLPKLTAEEQRSVDEIQAASDEPKYSKLKQLVLSAQNNPSKAVRLEAIESLMSFGKEALAEATTYLADTDQEVAEMAMDVIEQALADFDDNQEAAKLKYIESVLAVEGACNEDCANMLIGELNTMQNEPATAESIARLIEGTTDTTRLEQLREAYEFVTGEEYVDSRAAKDWAEQKRQEAAEDAEELE